MMDLSQITLPQGGNCQPAPWRLQALERFKAEGIPSRKLESWRQTPLQPWSKLAYRRAACPQPPDATVQTWLQQAPPNSLRVLVVDGYAVHIDPVPSGSGLAVHRLDDDEESLSASSRPAHPRPAHAESAHAAPTRPVSTALPKSADAGSALCMLNLAAASGRVSIAIADDTHAPQAIWIGLALSATPIGEGALGGPFLALPSIAIHLGRHAALDLILHQLDESCSRTHAWAPGNPAASAGLANSGVRGDKATTGEHASDILESTRVDIRLDEGSTLKTLRLVEGQSVLGSSVSKAVEEPTTTTTTPAPPQTPRSCRRLHAETASLARGARLLRHAFVLGGRLHREDLVVELGAPEANCELNALLQSPTNAHNEQHCRVMHSSEATRSQQSVRSLVDADGAAVVDLGSVVARDAQQSVAHQTSRNFMLAQGARVHAKPHLEIEADDVVCTHGATIGSLDEEAVFYMRSRGLDEKQARQMIIEAFSRSAFDAVENAALRCWVGPRVIPAWATDEAAGTDGPRPAPAQEQVS